MPSGNGPIDRAGNRLRREGTYGLQRAGGGEEGRRLMARPPIPGALELRDSFLSGVRTNHARLAALLREGQAERGPVSIAASRETTRELLLEKGGTPIGLAVEATKDGGRSVLLVVDRPAILIRHDSVKLQEVPAGMVFAAAGGRGVLADLPVLYAEDRLVVETDEPTTCLAVDEERFLGITGMRGSIAAGNTNLLHLVLALPFLAGSVRNNIARWRALAANFSPLDVKVGQPLITQGERDKRVYFVQDGLFEVSQQDEKGETVFSTLVGAGQVLGEMAAGNEGVRTASAKAMRDSRVLVFDPTDQTYERADAGDKQELTVTLAEVAHLRQTQGGWWGDAVPRLQRHAQLLGYTLSVPQAQFVLNLAAARVYKKGDVLIRQGDEVGEAGAPLFILGRGQFGFARTVSNRTGTGTFQPGDVVGGGGFLGRVPARTATITALEDSSIAYEIGPQHLAALNAQAFPFIQMVTALENRRRVG